MYEVRGWVKLAEEDDYKEGCLMNTGTCYNDHNMLFEGATANELIHKLMSFIGVNDESAVLLDSCDTKGRIDISVMETADGITAYLSDLKRWEKGQQKLWACLYTFYAFEVTRKQADLSGATGNYERE